MSAPTRTSPASRTAAASPARIPLRALLTFGAVGRALVGWIAVGGLALLSPPHTSPLLGATLAGTVAVIAVCAFGVVRQAERLAARLGDPLGTLVLTLSIVLIEVVLIVAVMLGPGEHATIARDAVLAVSMIILNLVVGLALLTGGMRRSARRQGGLRHNRSGTSQYLGLLVVLLAVTFGAPELVGIDGAFSAPQAAAVAAGTLAVYAFFLWRQTGAQAADFVEVAVPPPAAGHAVRRAVRAHRRELAVRVVLLALTMLPIILLSHDLAGMLDHGLALLHGPPMLSGLVIAGIVFLPEAITAVRAAWAGQAQRVSNLCHGALVSTVGLTVPAVLIVGLVTGENPVFAVDPAGALLLAVSLAVSLTTFAGRRATAAHGAVHLAVFALYVLVLSAPA